MAITFKWLGEVSPVLEDQSDCIVIWSNLDTLEELKLSIAQIEICQGDPSLEHGQSRRSTP